MGRTSSRKALAKVQINIRGIGLARPREQRPDEKRGKSPGSAAHHFKKGCPPGPAFRKGFQRRIPKFSDAYELALLQEVSAPLRKQLGVPKGATMMDVLVLRVVQQAMTGSIPHVTELREVTQGKVPNKNLNLTASTERLMEDPDFRAFVERQLDAYLAQQKGVINGNGTGVRKPSDKVPDSQMFDLES